MHHWVQIKQNEIKNGVVVNRYPDQVFESKVLQGQKTWKNVVKLIVD